MIRWCRISPLLPALLVLAACTTNPVTGKQSFTAFMSPEDEKRIGAEEHPKLVKEFGGAYGDAKLRAYVRRIGLKLVRVSEARDMPFTFTILDDDKVNAFALPGGYIYITRGLLALAGDEAEMAGVLAHEIGHVTARHTAERYSATMAANLGLMVLGVISSSAGMPSGVGRLVGLGAQAALSGYSREQELEADMLAVRYLTRAGYSPHAMTSFFHKMQAHAELEAALAGEKDGGERNNIMATHPRTAERISKAIGLANATAVKSPVVGREEFLAQIDGMVFGDDPHQGVRRGRLFTHPDLRIQFKVPPGFVLFNSLHRVIARGPRQSVIIFDMADEKTARETRSLTGYINSWAGNLGLGRVERIDINGLDAATAATRVSTRDGPRDVRFLAVRGGAERLFRFIFATPPSMTRRLEVELQRTTYSFRRISREEAEAIRPLRIKVVNVDAGDTPKSLAARMPFEKFGLRWFEVLNGLDPGQGLEPGRTVKIVTE
ncbi:MAG: M48 family metalloprotease [Proteobacteria bacterium]|nr:M48 family metalloprotease [Pseudomonadota bacterium]